MKSSDSPQPSLKGISQAPTAPHFLRILFVAARYLPHVGGTEMHTFEVARRLAASGHHVTVLTTDLDHRLPRSEQSEGINILRVPAWPTNRDFYFAPGIYREVTQGSWDIVHCQGYHTLVAPLAMLAALRAKTPYIVTFHSGGHSSRIRTLLRGLQRIMLRPMLKRAERLVGVSNFEAAFFREQLQLPAELFCVISNGGHLPQIQKPQSVAENEALIVSVGRLERYKGHHRVIAALPKILEQAPEVRLRIVGAGPFEAGLRHLAEELGVAHKVEIGGVPAGNRQEMASILSRASLVTLLSDYEANPVSALEALALGKSLLVTDTSGLRELAEQGLAQAIPLNCTVEETAKAVVEQLLCPLVPQRVDLRTWDACAAELASLYSSVLSKEQAQS